MPELKAERRASQLEYQDTMRDLHRSTATFAVMFDGRHTYHVYPDGRRVYVGLGWRSDPIEAAKAAYVAGDIEVDELERRVAAALGS